MELWEMLLAIGGAVFTAIGGCIFLRYLVDVFSRWKRKLSSKIDDMETSLESMLFAVNHVIESHYKAITDDLKAFRAFFDEAVGIELCAFIEHVKSEWELEDVEKFERIKGEILSQVQAKKERLVNAQEKIEQVVEQRIEKVRKLKRKRLTKKEVKHDTSTLAKS